MAMMLTNYEQYQLMQQAMQAKLLQERFQIGGATLIPAPELPAGYQLLADLPRPLSTDGEEWWIVFALHVGLDALGMLVYTTDAKVVTFLSAQESLLTLFAMLDNLLDLAADCTERFTDDHMEELYILAKTWREIHTINERICAWCWEETHPCQPFPAKLSSTCCDKHKAVAKGGAA